MEERRPRTPEEYVRLVEQAIGEVHDLRAGLDYDIEEEGARYVFLEPLEKALTELRASMADGSYHFANEDLPYMKLVNRFRRSIPFAKLLARINETHRKGLDIDAA